MSPAGPRACSMRGPRSSPTISSGSRVVRRRSTSSHPLLERVMDEGRTHWSSRLPFYYGWLIVGIAFVTMAIAVTARTAFSLLMPPLIEEFGWDRGLAAGAFSFGFLVSAVLSPFVGRVLDTRGPRVVILAGMLL